ncbi:MAG TPA: TlpA disulfide reductase family protein [Burkholderiales bacterium]|nr:TlpA disulfide reductase family protein [Burkholderiales bacterium]
MDRRRAITVAGIGIGAAAAGAIAGAFFWQQRSGAAALLNTVFPDLHGQARRLRDWQGKTVVVNFWATWCEPCREEIPLLIQASDTYAGRGLEVVGIAIDTVDKIREFGAKFGISYTSLVGDMRALDLIRQLGNPAGALPFSVILDRAGAVASRKLGAYKDRELDRELTAILR